MEKQFLQKQNFKSTLYCLFLLLTIVNSNVNAQCTVESGKIKGVVFNDSNNNGNRDVNENFVSNTLVSLYNTTNQLVSFTTTNTQGEYLFSGLADGNKYRLSFEYLPKYVSSYVGDQSKSSIQFVTVPACNASLGLVTFSNKCDANPQLFTTCFVQGSTSGPNKNVETVIGLEHNFGPSSSVNKFGMHEQTGSVWGIAWKSTTGELFTSSFVKQYAGLTSHGHSAIFKSNVSGNGGNASLFVKLSDLGINVGNLSSLDPSNCEFGNQVGKAGLGGMVISPDEQYLYVVNIGGKSIVRIPTVNPTASNVQVTPIPNPNCSNGEFYPFALKYYNDKLYVGITCTAETSKTEANSMAVVYEMDLNARTFTNIFSTDYLKGYWKDTPSNDLATQHWFTDIDFTDNENMLLSFSDRVGHKYCNLPSNRLDHQYPDLLMAWKDNGVWKLESNGKAGTLTGTGVGNSQGPGGGEFFGNDYWISQPEFHPEIALGSIYVLPGSGSVVATTYDPGVNAYSGGFQKYSTTDGSKIAAKELYTRQIDVLFGKATGFGDITGRCGLPKIQVGNLVWLDINKNGIQDAGEQAASNVPMVLLDAGCNVISSVNTNEKGEFIFSDLIPGAQYYIGLGSGIVDNQFQLVTLGSVNYTFSPAVSNNSLIDNNAIFNLNTCDNGVIPVNYTQTNHTLDIGLIVAGNFDLALKNEIQTNDFSRLNELIDFKITIYNQGGVPAKNIKIADYIPSGYTFSQSDNPGWTLTGNMAMTTISEILPPNSSISRVIKLKIISNDLTKLVNAAEIVEAFDHTMTLRQDIDSTPDSNPGNDNGGDVNSTTDNVVNDSGIIDEDDEDPAMPKIVDLALRQVLQNECYTGGECVNISMTVFNQGNTAVSSFNLVNYINPTLSFASNNGWTLNDTYLQYTGSTLLPGESRTIPLSVCIRDGVLTTDIINFAEISQIAVNGITTIRDFDSNPDNTSGNDAGGVVETNQDNYILGTMGVEEDDHDPIKLGVKFIDLALKLTTDSRRVKENDNVCFDVFVYNQGSQTINEIQIIDYIPAGLQLKSEDWTLSNDKVAVKNIAFEDGFRPGAEYNDEICFIVKNLNEIFYIENIAEVSSITDACDEDASAKDIDSQADITKDNDLGGHPQTDTDNIVNGLPSQDEDDHDPAVLINYSSLVAPCVCLANGTNSSNGQFAQQVSIRGPKNMIWTVDLAVNIYLNTSAAPPAAPTPFPAVYFLTEVPVNATTSDYVLNGIFEDGRTYTLILKSNFDDYETIIGGGCSYAPTVVSGTQSLCTGLAQTYSAPIVAGGYSVIVSGGGIITASNADSSKVEITWGAIPGLYTVTFERKSATACNEPGILKIAIGNPHTAMACKSNIQISLDGNCSVEVTPSMLVAGDLQPDAPYSVMLTDDKSNPILNATLDATHVGKEITAKLIEGCSGNSCWGKIKVEDKTAPTLVCVDTVEVSCFKIDEYPGPIAQDNCGGAIKINKLTENISQLYCNVDYNAFISRSYQAVDKYGNKSAVCNQVLAVRRISMDSIDFPADIEMSNALTCSGYELDENGNPHPSVTGSPSIEGNSLYPNFHKSCNVGVSYTDRDFGYIGCTRKIMRVWLAYEAWCVNGVIKLDTQTIIILDREAPKFKCPKDFTVSAGPTECEALANFPAITGITDDCSLVFSVNVAYPGGFSPFNGGSGVLPVGKSKIKYTVYDQCLNRDSCSMTVTVVDKTAPTVVCDRNTTIGITSLGQGYLYASTIDDGSYDACGLDSLRVKRLDNSPTCGLTHIFRNTATFCCQDVGKEIMVELKAWDRAGNSNSCMVNVLVQDKTVPTITCPDEVTISCEVNYNLNNLNQYGVATAQDACGATVTEVARDEVNQCRVGFIERIFSASDQSNTVRCTSYIRIQKTTGPVTITWPRDYSVVGSACSPADLDPSRLPAINARPTFNDGICDLVAASFEDEYFPFDDGQGSCFKIIRTWTVIDWCRKSELDYRPATWQQLIKVSNTVDPTIEVDAEGSACTDPDRCDEGFISLVAEGNDDCTPDANLYWRYDIDLNFSGTFTSDISDNGFGHEIDASAGYPVGNHRIIFTFEDRCGNQTSTTHNFIIKNCKAPSPVCRNGTIALQQMVVNGQTVKMACIPARSLNASSSSFCQLPLTYSFTRNINDTTLCFNCTNLGINNIPLYVTDSDGNFASCNAVIEVQNNDNSTISLSTPDDILCNGQNTTITATILNMPGSTIIWSSGQTTPSITVSPTTTTTYTVSVTSTDLCTLSKSITITVNPLPAVLINGQVSSNLPNGGVSEICPGQSATLTATGGTSYIWNTNPAQTTASITVSPASTTNYTVTVTDANGCTNTALRTVVVKPIPPVQISPGAATLCLGQSITLVAAGGVTYLWNTGATSNTITVTPPLGTPAYTVTVTGTNGCTNSLTRTITVNPVPTAAITGNTNVCPGGTTTLTASGGGTYLWSTGATTASISPTNINAPTTYTVTVTNSSNCTDTESVTVNINPVPVVNILPNPATICNGQSIILTASGGTTYAWNTNPVQTTAAITVNPTTTTTYTVTVTNTQGCTATLSRVVTVNPLPIPSITGDLAICQNESTTLTASGGTTYAWNTNPVQTTAAITVTPLSTTTYTVTVSNGNGCSATSSATVVVSPGITAAINTVAPICAGQSATLTASGGGAGATFAWNTNPVQTTASITVTPPATTTYTVTVTSSAGCSDTESRIVEVKPNPVPVIAGNLVICNGQSTTLTASNSQSTTGNTFAWNTNPVQTTAAITVNPTTNTTYTVTITNNGCSANTSAAVTVNPLPTVGITGNGTICQGESSTLTASGGVSYAWNTNPVQTTATITVTPATTTTYIVTVTNNNNCTNTGAFTVNVTPKPNAVITGDLNICLGESTTLTASNSLSATGNTFAWNTNPVQTTASITVTPTTTTSYTVTVTNNNCTDTETVSVNVNPNNTPTAICKNITVFVDASGSVTINPNDINNNSLPGCNEAPLTFAVSPAILFCNDISVSPVTVTLTVTSSTGQSSTCTAQVTVRDTLDPIITCPPNLTIPCETFAGLAGLPIATATDNCPPVVVTQQVINATNVCNIGTITRTFTATDQRGNTSQCTQIIIVSPSTDPLRATDITFPNDTTLTTCITTLPSVTGSPIVNFNAATCERVSVTYTDVQTPPNAVCNFTIQRTWRVVDSCQLIPGNSTAGIFTDVQTITVNDTAPPVISGYVNITVSSPTCPVQINYPIGNTSITDCSALTVTNNSPFATNPNSGNPSGLYEEGVTTVIITAMDPCGNMAKDTITITVTLTDTLLIICKKIIVSIESNDQVTVSTADIIESIVGTCDADEFKFSWSKTDPNDSLIVFDCSFLGDSLVYAFFYDQNNMIFDSCKSIITITDPQGFCTGNIFRISGEINTENYIPVEGVKMDLSGMGDNITTNKDGKYFFPNMNSSGDYMLKPVKNDGLLEGVSTMDLIMIQRHILGVSKLNSPYKMIAADVNNDNKISAADLVDLRKALLGISDKFKNNTSWKLVDELYQFPDRSNPFNSAYPLYYEFISPLGNRIVNFVGVKIGDVNASYVANKSKNLAANKANLIMDNKKGSSGQDMNLEVIFEGKKFIDGIQLEYKIENLADVKVTSEIFNEDQLFYTYDNGKLKIIIALNEAIELNNTKIFNIAGVAITNDYSSNMIGLTHSDLSSELYLSDSRQAVKIDQTFRNIDEGIFSVSYNSPNPWYDKTTINFNLPIEGNVQVILRELDGRVILTRSLYGAKGANKFELNGQDLEGKTGVILYEFNHEGKSLHGKMIRIK